MNNPWSKPNCARQPNLSAEQKTKLAERGLKGPVSLRIGAKDGVSTHVMAKINAHLSRDQLICVQFVKMKKGQQEQCCHEVVEGAGAIFLGGSGDLVVFFRKSPEGSLKELMDE